MRSNSDSGCVIIVGRRPSSKRGGRRPGLSTASLRRLALLSFALYRALLPVMAKLLDHRREALLHTLVAKRRF